MIADSLRICRGVAALTNLARLVVGDNPADYRKLPVIVRSN